MPEREIERAAETLRQLLDENPSLDEERLEEQWYMHELPKRPPVRIKQMFPAVPPELEELRVIPASARSPEQSILEGLLAVTLPAQSGHPFSATLYTGLGPGTMASFYGMKLKPELKYAPDGIRKADDIVHSGMPDPLSDGLGPVLVRLIRRVKELTPSFVRIAPPDTQGPFNIAHMLIGNDVFTLPLDDPDLFEALMSNITAFYMHFYTVIREEIGGERYVRMANARTRLRLCSVNLISSEMYEEYVASHDRRIAEYFGEVCVHPCSGRHVFHAALRCIPNVLYIEAMPFGRSVAPSIGVEEAIEAIGSQHIRLMMERKVSDDNFRTQALKDSETVRRHPTFRFIYDVEGISKTSVIALNSWMMNEWRGEP
jgi:hypothetical protein